MIARTAKPCRLHVEGTDDVHVIRHLLTRYRVDSRSLPHIENCGGKDGVIRSIRTGIPAAEGRPVGFVLDANNEPIKTWERVTSGLRKRGVKASDELPASGFVGESDTFDTRVGIWLMPDNRRTGAVEHFLEDLIKDGDPLYAHAVRAADRARHLGAKFSIEDALKARLHTWLAWQEEPGRPYGVAIRARFFGDDSDAARRLVAWYARLSGALVAGP